MALRRGVAARRSAGARDGVPRVRGARGIPGRSPTTAWCLQDASFYRASAMARSKTSLGESFGESSFEKGQPDAEWLVTAQGRLRRRDALRRRAPGRRDRLSAPRPPRAVRVQRAFKGRVFKPLRRRRPARRVFEAGRLLEERDGGRGGPRGGADGRVRRAGRLRGPLVAVGHGASPDRRSGSTPRREAAARTRGPHVRGVADSVGRRRGRSGGAGQSVSAPVDARRDPRAGIPNFKMHFSLGGRLQRPGETFESPEIRAGDVVVTDNYAALHTAAPGTTFNDRPRLISRVCVPGGHVPRAPS